MSVLDLLSVLLISGGVLFFLAGTAGLIRFPDPLTRLHAIAKADNFGLSLVVLGLICRAEAVSAAVQLALVWGVSLMSAVVGAHLIFHVSLRTPPEERETEE
jgi:multicomponent Na+:H+ antiporter subunit G